MQKRTFSVEFQRSMERSDKLMFEAAERESWLAWDFEMTRRGPMPPFNEVWKAAMQEPYTQILCATEVPRVCYFDLLGIAQIDNSLRILPMAPRSCLIREIRLCDFGKASALATHHHHMRLLGSFAFPVIPWAVYLEEKKEAAPDRLQYIGKPLTSWSADDPRPLTYAPRPYYIRLVL
jgi:hypothetical protein